MNKKNKQQCCLSTEVIFTFQGSNNWRNVRDRDRERERERERERKREIQREIQGEIQGEGETDRQT